MHNKNINNLIINLLLVILVKAYRREGYKYPSLASDLAN